MNKLSYPSVFIFPLWDDDKNDNRQRRRIDMKSLAANNNVQNDVQKGNLSLFNTCCKRDGDDDIDLFSPKYQAAKLESKSMKRDERFFNFFIFLFDALNVG